MAGTPITPFDLETVTTVAETDHLMIFSDGAENDITTLNFLKKLREITDANLADVRFATLDSNQKLNTAQLPTGYDFDAPLGNWSKDNDDPVLTDGTGTAGDSYVVVDTGTVAEGAGTLSLLDGVTVTAGDRIWYTGSVWDHAPKASNLFDGTTDADSAATAGDYYRKGAVDERQLSKAPANAAVFDGSASVLSNADASDLLVGGDGTNDNKLFARFAIYIDDLTSGFPICGRFDSAKREWFFSVNSSGFLFFRAYDDSAAQVVSATASTLPLVVGRWYIVELYYNGAGGASAMNGVTLRVNGVDCSVTVSNSGNYVAMEDKGGSFRVGEDNNGGAHSDGRISGGIVGNTDLGGSGEYDLVVAPEDQWSDGTTATSGTLTVGKKYRINTFVAGDDFTNVGAASNATGVEFVATGNTPTTWTNSSVVGQVGALVSYQARSIFPTGNVNDESSNGLHLGATSVRPLFRPTGGQFAEEFELAHGSISSSAATTELISLPKGCRILGIETIVVTDFDGSTTLSIGITGTATKYVNALDVASTGRNYNASTSASESDTASTSIYVQKNQATTQGNAKFRVIYEITNPTA